MASNTVAHECSPSRSVYSLIAVVGSRVFYRNPESSNLRMLCQESNSVKILQTRSAQFHPLASRRTACDIGSNQEAAAIPMLVGDSQRDVDLSQTLVNRDTLAFPIGYPAVTENTARLQFLESCTHCKDQYPDNSLRPWPNSLGGP